MDSHESIVDVCFPLVGGTIPADHGYALFGAVARQLPDVHGDETIGIHPINGRPIGQRQLGLTPSSQLAVRLPLGRLPELVKLAGQQLDLDGHLVRLGAPTVRQLNPAPTLRSRLVVIKGFLEAEPFLEAARRQLAERSVAGQPGLLVRQRARALEAGRGSAEPLLRRTLRVRDKQVVGYALAVTGLGATDSLRLQELGLGGRRRFGCGVFVPWSR